MYSAADVKDVVKSQILDLLFNFSNINSEEFCNYRNNLIQEGKEFIIKNYLK